MKARNISLCTVVILLLTICRSASANIEQYLRFTTFGLYELKMESITLEDAREIADYLKANKLSSIDIDGIHWPSCRFDLSAGDQPGDGDNAGYREYIMEIFRIIAGALRENISLTTLSLHNLGGYQGITRVDVGRMLAEALRVNRTLTSLKLALCPIGPDGAGHLAEALRHNNTLVELNLARSNIGTHGAMALAGMLEENRTLVRLSLYRNDIGHMGYLRVVECLIGNLTLQYFELHHDEAQILGTEEERWLEATILKRNRLIAQVRNGVMHHLASSAFTMTLATHPRLGAGSLLHGMPQHLLRHIVNYLDQDEEFYDRIKWILQATTNQLDSIIGLTREDRVLIDQIRAIQNEIMTYVREEMPYLYERVQRLFGVQFQQPENFTPYGSLIWLWDRGCAVM
jgi:hypothetical protein